MSIVTYLKKLRYKFLSKAKQEEILSRCWFDEHIDYRAVSIKTKYAKFTHIVPIDKRKCFMEDGYHFILTTELREYTYPQRPLNESVIITIERGFWDNYYNDFVLNGIGDTDQTFAITNSDRDAFIISLKYC